MMLRGLVTTFLLCLFCLINVLSFHDGSNSGSADAKHGSVLFNDIYIQWLFNAFDYNGYCFHVLVDTVCDCRQRSHSHRRNTKYIHDTIDRYHHYYLKSTGSFEKLLCEESIIIVDGKVNESRMGKWREVKRVSSYIMAPS